MEQKFENAEVLCAAGPASLDSESGRATCRLRRAKDVGVLNADRYTYDVQRVTPTSWCTCGSKCAWSPFRLAHPLNCYTTKQGGRNPTNLASLGGQPCSHVV